MALFANHWGFVPRLRWPWRTLQDLQPDVAAVMSALARGRGRPPFGNVAACDALYETLEALDPDARPTHTRLARLAAELRQHRRRLDDGGVRA